MLNDGCPEREASCHLLYMIAVLTLITSGISRSQKCIYVELSLLELLVIRVRIVLRSLFLRTKFN